RFDHTNYFQVVPAHTLETMLWAEADRMKGLDITQENLTNQQGVVANEVRVNVLNQPYGGFPWLDLPQQANTNWYNAHNFYGDLAHLEAATLEDVASFFETYYAPSNAALVVVGDFDVAQARAFIEKYFAHLPKKPEPTLPDLSEPRQTEEKRASRKDPLATRPALGFAYHVPPRNTPEYYAMGLIDQLLVQGDDSLLAQELVNRRGYTGEVGGGINYLLGNMFNYEGPMLWMASLIHDPATSSAEVLAAVDGVIATLQDQPLDQAALDRAIVKWRSEFYDMQTQFGGFGRADLLASFALFDDDPARINGVEAELRKV